MMFPFAVALLYSGSIALVQSTEYMPPTFREMLSSFPLKRDELVQRRQELFTQRLLAATHVADSNPRYLQAATSSPTSAQLCNADGGVNFNDDFDQAVFQGDFETMCTCSEEENIGQILDALGALISSPNSTDSFAEDFNSLVGMVEARFLYMCTNGCESCYNGVCGLLEITEDSFFGSTKSNFTESQILRDEYESTPFVYTNSTFYFSTCFDYTSGSPYNGKLCFGVDDGAETDVDSEEKCFIEYDNVECNSCLFDVDVDSLCYVADCTNIYSSAVIDSCNRTGFSGPFMVLELLDRVIMGSDLTLGSCDVPPASNAPTDLSPPVSAVSPNAPVPSPVKVPTAVTPNAAPMTSESPVLGKAMYLLAFWYVIATTYFL